MRNWQDGPWVVIMVFGAFFAGVLYANMPADGQWQPGWEMVSGLGTTAAAIAALWISGREERRVRQQAEVQAVIVAARIYLPLDIYAGKVRASADFFSKTPSIGVSYTYVVEQMKIIKGLLDEKVVEDAELGPLAGLGDNTSILIAGAYGNLQRALITMEYHQWDFAQIDPGYIERRNIARSICALILNDAAQQLSMATRSCKSAAIAFTSAHAGPLQAQSLD